MATIRKTRFVRNALRQRADAAALKNTASSSDTRAEHSWGAMQQTIHELRLQQIGLALQNDELRQTQAALDTARRQAENRLKESEQKLSLILENVDACIYLKDPQGRYLFVNRPVCELFAAPLQEIVGRNDKDFFDAATSAQLHENERPVFQNGETSRTVNVDFRLRDGRTLTFLSVILPLHNAAGEVVALCCISTDITERKQLQAAQLTLTVGAELATSRQRLRELVALNEATLEEERKHIAREVHDELGQVLTALRMDMSLMSMRYGALDPALTTEVHHMKTIVDRAIQGVRNVVTHLRPTALDMGLAPAIEWLCQEFSRINALPCKLDAPGNLTMDESRSVLIFRILPLPARRGTARLSAWSSPSTLAQPAPRHDPLAVGRRPRHRAQWAEAYFCAATGCGRCG